MICPHWQTSGSPVSCRAVDTEDQSRSRSFLAQVSWIRVKNSNIPTSYRQSFPPPARGLPSSADRWSVRLARAELNHPLAQQHTTNPSFLECLGLDSVEISPVVVAEEVEVDAVVVEAAGEADEVAMETFHRPNFVSAFIT